MKRFFCLAAILSAIAFAEDLPVRVIVRPTPVYVEHAGATLLVNCDFIAENKSKEKWTLSSIQVSVYDASGKLQLRKFVNDNGNSPSVETVNKREVLPGQRILIFNPLFSFSDAMQLSAVEYRFSWYSNDKRREVSNQVNVTPRSYLGKESLRLPIRGRILIWDGHDYYAHHRRFDYMNPSSQQDGTNSNLDRYGYDFVPINEAGEMHKGKPEENMNWFGFDQPIYAAGNGKVVAAVDDGFDNREVDAARFAENKLADYGNYIVIDHGGGEFALYGHIKNGSAKVKAGEFVRTGQQIGSIGASGSSLMPHLHFQLQTTADADGEGLPSYFDHFQRLLGSRSLTVRRGQIDSGEIVQDIARQPK